MIVTHQSDPNITFKSKQPDPNIIFKTKQPDLNNTFKIKLCIALMFLKG